MSYRLHTVCRACSGTDLREVFDLGLQPLANDLQKNGDVRQGFYPLKVMMCSKCTLSQLSATVDPDVLYSRYLYVTSQSETMRRHFERLFCDLASENAGSTLLEIGSNDGTLLQFAKAKGYSVAGVDPAVNLAEIADRNGIFTYPHAFTSATAAMMAKSLSPTVILARHCFAHIDGWRDFFHGIELLSAHNPLIAIEVPYVHDLLAKSEFDSVYHEHLSYVSITPVVHLLFETPFRLHRVIRYGIHGGSLLIMLRHKDSGIQPHLSADEYLSEDTVTVQHWERFGINARQKINRMREAVLDANEKGKIVCGFGASAKASVWISACGFTSKQIRFVSDNSPLKPGRLMPGTDIPIIHQDELLSYHPDFAVLFCWNFLQDALDGTKEWRKRGGRFLVPTPDGVTISG